MANTIPSIYMSLPVPVPGVDPGPQYAIDLNSCLTVIDSHDHSSGRGVQINPAGININTDFTFNGNNATSLRTVRFTSQTGTLTGASDLGCLYEVNNDLYYNSGTGAAVQITSGSGIAGTPGSISNLTSPATASYVAANSTFVWQSNANTPANLDAASLLLRNLSANSKSLTLQPPNAMGANYALTLPSLPAAQSFLAIDTSGNITGFAATSQGITNSMIANGTITSAKISASAGITGSQLSASAGITGAQLSGSAGITGAQIANSTVGGGNLVNNINLPGSAVQENGKNVVVSSTNASTSLAIIRGWVQGRLSPGAATVMAGEGFTCTRTVTGQYSISFNVAFASAPIVTVTAVSSGQIAGATVIPPLGGTGSFAVQIWRDSTSAEVVGGSLDACQPFDTDFMFTVIGPR